MDARGFFCLQRKSVFENNVRAVETSRSHSVGMHLSRRSRVISSLDSSTVRGSTDFWFQASPQKITYWQVGGVRGWGARGASPKRDVFPDYVSFRDRNSFLTEISLQIKKPHMFLRFFCMTKRILLKLLQAYSVISKSKRLSWRTL